MACEALSGPHKSNAIGPTSATKHPSNKPMNRQITMNHVNELANVKSIVKMPIAKKAVC